MPVVMVNGTFTDLGNDNFKAQISSLKIFDGAAFKEADAEIKAEYNNKLASCVVSGAGSGILTITSTDLPVIPGVYTRQPSPSASLIPGTWKLTDSAADFAERTLVISASSSFSFEGKFNTSAIPEPIASIVSAIAGVIVNGTFMDMGNDIYKAEVTSGKLFNVTNFITAYGAYLASIPLLTPTLPEPSPNSYYSDFDPKTIAEYSNKTAKFALSNANATLTITSPDNLPVIPGVYTKQ
jgi:hypothetical protein